MHMDESPTSPVGAERFFILYFFSWTEAATANVRLLVIGSAHRAWGGAIKDLGRPRAASPSVGGEMKTTPEGQNARRPRTGKQNRDVPNQHHLRI